MDRRMQNSRWGDVEYLRVGLKGTHPSKAHWIEKDKEREKFTHLHVD